MKKTEIASVRLTEDEKQQLERLAQLQDRSESYVLRKMLLAGLRQSQAKPCLSCLQDLGNIDELITLTA